MMKKLTLMLLVIQSGFMMAQTTKTFLTVNGERVPMNPNPVNTANNGLEAQNGNVQLGGALIKKTTLVTTPSNTLALQGLQNGTNKDSVLVADSAGVLKLVPRSVFNAEGDNLGNHTATQNINLGDNYLNGDGKDVWGLRFYDKNAWFERTTISAKADYVVRPSNKISKDLDFLVQTRDEGPFQRFGYNEVLSEASNFVIPKLDLSSLSDYNTFADYYTNTYGTTTPDFGLVFNTNAGLMPNLSGEGLYFRDDSQWKKIGDDLGNHIASQNLNMKDYYISGDTAGSWGLKFDSRNKIAQFGAFVNIGALQALNVDKYNIKDIKLVGFTGEAGGLLSQTKLTTAFRVGQIASGVIFSATHGMTPITPSAISLSNPYYIPFVIGMVKSPITITFATVNGGSAFVAPKDGYYQFHGSVRQTLKSNFQDGKPHNFKSYLDLMVNSNIVASTGISNQVGFSADDFNPLEVSKIVFLKKGDKVMLRAGNNYRDIVYNMVKDSSQGQAGADAMESAGTFNTEIKNSSDGIHNGVTGAIFEGFFVGPDENGNSIDD